MPQVFQVFRCYKCSIFQVHQTKKDNKWKCKVCGEKQSVKRHYNLGTAKDCRLHVQKLNNMQGDIIEALKLKTDTDSDYEDNTENDIKITSTQALTNNAKKDSKWSAYVEKEEISKIQAHDYIDKVKECSELSQKRKKNIKAKPFKVPKLTSNENCIATTDDINNLSTSSCDELNSFYLQGTGKCNDESNVQNRLESRTKNNDMIINKSVNFQTSKASKWAQYDISQNGDNSEDIENNGDCRKECIGHYENHNIVENNQKREESVGYNDDQKHIKNINDNKNYSKKKDIAVKYPSASKAIFSLCDDDDIDNILDF